MRANFPLRSRARLPVSFISAGASDRLEVVMHQDGTFPTRTAAAAFWTAAAALSLSTAGCQQAPPTGASIQPTERVAGSRQEQRAGSRSTSPAPRFDSLATTLRDAGLPRRFAFGGRTWEAHEIQWASREDVKPSAPGTGAVTARPGKKPTPPGPAAAAARRATEALDLDDFVPMANLTVNGTQIYRKKGMDEAFTDNIFLTATMAGNQIGFVEYDAVDNWLEKADLARVIDAAKLPQTVTWGGKTWRAAAVQLYDADVFDDVKPIQDKVSGFTGFEGEDNDVLFLLADLPEGAAIAEKAADKPAPGATRGETAPGGPIFIRYDAVRS
jgi:hypothetical protein